MAEKRPIITEEDRRLVVDWAIVIGGGGVGLLGVSAIVGICVRAFLWTAGIG